MRTITERPLPALMLAPTDVVGDALAELAEALAPRPIPEDVDEILGLRCSSL